MKKDKFIDLTPDRKPRENLDYITIGFRAKSDDPIIGQMQTICDNEGKTVAFMVRKMVIHCVKMFEERRK